VPAENCRVFRVRSPRDASLRRGTWGFFALATCSLQDPELTLRSPLPRRLLPEFPSFIAAPPLDEGDPVSRLSLNFPVPALSTYLACDALVHARRRHPSLRRRAPCVHRSHSLPAMRRQRARLGPVARARIDWRALFLWCRTGVPPCATVDAPLSPRASPTLLPILPSVPALPRPAPFLAFPLVAPLSPLTTPPPFQQESSEGWLRCFAPSTCGFVPPETTPRPDVNIAASLFHHRRPRLS
jgi:hypothetical protein